MESWILTILIFFPLAATVVLGFLIPKENLRLLRGFTFVVTLVEFMLSLFLLFRFRDSVAGMQFVVNKPWIDALNVHYHLGVDGISLWLVMLTTFLPPLVILSAFSGVKERVKEYMICMLVMVAGMIGVFVALDLFLFYIFWEVMLIPMYLLIGIWGSEKRIYAALKFFIYTFVGSIFMLVAILYLAFMARSQLGSISFNILDLYRLQIPVIKQYLLFAAFGLAFAIKVPMFPFHTWLPDAHVEAPTGGSVLLAAVLLKMGVYGFIRFAMPLFPEAVVYFAPFIMLLAVIGIIYGAYLSFAQPDLKKLVAYSSVSHLGFVMLGLFALNEQGVSGGILQSINHGLSTGALFLCVGVLYERRHTRLIENFGGISRIMPVYSAIFMIVTLSSIGLPGLNGFIGEFLILLGAFLTNWKFAVFAATGVVFAAVYMLQMFKRVMFGEVTHPENEGLKDLSLREVLYFLPIVFFIILIGIYPKPFLSKMDASVNRFLSQVNPVRISHGALDPAGKSGKDFLSSPFFRTVHSNGVKRVEMTASQMPKLKAQGSRLKAQNQSIKNKTFNNQ